ALTHARFCREIEPPAQLQGLFSIFEATLRYLVALGLSDLLTSLALADDDSVALPAHRAFDLLRKESNFLVGRWAETLRETARALGGQPRPFVPELPARCRPGEAAFENLISSLVRQRNDWAHPTHVQTPDDCARAVEEARPRVEELLQHVRLV